MSWPTLEELEERIHSLSDTVSDSGRMDKDVE